MQSLFWVPSPTQLSQGWNVAGMATFHPQGSCVMKVSNVVVPASVLVFSLVLALGIYTADGKIFNNNDHNNTNNNCLFQQLSVALQKGN